MEPIASLRRWPWRIRRCFDTLDFDVDSNQLWGLHTESHSPDIVVHWPDRPTTRGLAHHIEYVKAQFTWVPDSRVEGHRIRIANGERTAVTGIVLSNFTLPMHKPDGQVIKPVGNAFRLPVVALGRWVGGVMDENYLLWDNVAFLAKAKSDCEAPDSTGSLGAFPGIVLRPAVGSGLLGRRQGRSCP